MNFWELGIIRLVRLPFGLFRLRKLIRIMISGRRKLKVPGNSERHLGLTDNQETNVFRLIHAEGDGMPGLIVDFYNGTAVMQMHSIGMYSDSGRTGKSNERSFG